MDIFEHLNQDGMTIILITHSRELAERCPRIITLSDGNIVRDAGRADMLKENLKLAWKALMSNKLRAMLTMLGIIIGIGSVITIVTIGDAITGNINKEWSGYGAAM